MSSPTNKEGPYHISYLFTNDFKNKQINFYVPVNNGRSYTQLDLIIIFVERLNQPTGKSRGHGRDTEILFKIKDSDASDDSEFIDVKIRYGTDPEFLKAYNNANGTHHGMDSVKWEINKP